MASILVAQLTDTHVTEPDTDEELYVDNNGRVAEAVKAINAESPPVDAVLATGDLTQWGSSAEYSTLIDLLGPLEAIVLPLAGNHDDRDRLRASFADHPWVDADHASWTVDVHGVRIIGLDSTLPGEPGAEYDIERDRWLRATLGESHDGPTILAMHHPPFRSGIDWMDNAGFIGLDRLEMALRDLGNVDRVLCGHMHRPMSSTIAGIPAEVGLSTAVHIALDLTPDAPLRTIRDPAGYRLHAINASQTVSHIRYIATGEEPFFPGWATESFGDP